MGKELDDITTANTAINEFNTTPGGFLNNERGHWGSWYRDHWNGYRLRWRWRWGNNHLDGSRFLDMDRSRSGWRLNNERYWRW